MTYNKKNLFSVLLAIMLLSGCAGFAKKIAISITKQRQLNRQSTNLEYYLMVLLFPQQTTNVLIT
jgi:outer membrane murein-binding lipoprotein Lpp